MLCSELFLRIAHEIQSNKDVVNYTCNLINMSVQNSLQSIKLAFLQLLHICKYASKVTAIKVGEELLEQRALLLPTAYDWFTSEVNQILRLRNQSIPNTELNEVASPQWLRSQFSSLLKQHIAFFCKIKKYGTVLYRYGGDLLHSLNIALGQHRLNQQLHNRLVPTETKVAENEANEPRSITKDACIYLNDKVHTYISDLIKQDSQCT